MSEPEHTDRVVPLWWVPGDELQGRHRECAVQKDCGLTEIHVHIEDQIFLSEEEVREAYPDGLPYAQTDPSIRSSAIQQWLSASWPASLPAGVRPLKPPSNHGNWSPPSRTSDHLNHVHVSVMSSGVTPPQVGTVVDIHGNPVTDSSKQQPYGIVHSWTTDLAGPNAGATTVNIMTGQIEVEAKSGEPLAFSIAPVDTDVSDVGAWKPAGIMTGPIQINYSDGVLITQDQANAAAIRMTERMAQVVIPPQFGPRIGNI